MSNKDSHLSKTLSWLLRHGAVREGLSLSSEGYIEVSKILQHKSLRGRYSIGDVERVVNNNNKQRFKLRTNPLTNAAEIKANQGHSVEVSDAELTPILEPTYNTVVHGTYLNSWPQIKLQGLSCMRRQHIHCAKGTLEDCVISGLRHNVQVYIFINLKKALDDGLKFYESDNGVILTRGNEKGFLEPKYFSKVIKVSTGYPTYSQLHDLVRVFSKLGSVCVDRMGKAAAVLSFANEHDAKAAVNASKKVNIYGEYLTVKPYNSKQAEAKPAPPGRDFSRSKQKDTIVEPQKIDLSGDFHSQLDRVLGRVRLTQEEATAVSQLYGDLERVLQPQWPGCVAMPFGSITTGLGIKTSDADCYMHVPAKFQHGKDNFVNKAKRILQAYPSVFAEILSIPRANTPIVKFFYIPTETNCDLSFKSPLGTQNSKLIAFLLQADPRLLPMAVVIKYWAKVHALSGTGRLTNYALTMLIIFYLQQPPVSILPPVEWLQRDLANDLMVDFWNTGFMDRRELLPKTSNTSSIPELLGGFFEYYSLFNFEEMVVCPFLGCPVKKELFSSPIQLPGEFRRYKLNVEHNIAMPLRANTPICVQDPFEQCHNVASAITTRLASEIKEFFKFAANAYEKEKLNECKEFLSIILLQKPKIVRAKSHPEYRVNLFPKIIVNIINPDWKTVIRQAVFTIFERMLKIKLGKVEEKVNPDSKKEKEKYIAILNKAVWRRKRFSKVYNASIMDFQQRQARITEEVYNIEKDKFVMQFQVILTYAHDPKSSVVAIKLSDGDAEAFKEFGKFFISAIQNWFMVLLKPQAKPLGNTAANIAESIKFIDNINAIKDSDSDDEEVDETNENSAVDPECNDSEDDNAAPDVANVNNNDEKCSSSIETATNCLTN